MGYIVCGSHVHHMYISQFSSYYLYVPKYDLCISTRLKERSKSLHKYQKKKVMKYNVNKLFVNSSLVLVNGRMVGWRRGILYLFTYTYIPTHVHFRSM